MNKKVLVSTDIGSDIDDALSLLVMLNHPGIDLRGIDTVNGLVRARSYIAKKMVNLSGRNIPVRCGESRSLTGLVEPYFYFEDRLIHEDFHDKKKMEEEFYSEIPLRPLSECGIIENGVEDLANQLSRGKYVVFSLAPMTNIAKLLLEHPDAAKNIEKLYVMGFSIPEQRREHNVVFDPNAAKAVLESDIPLTIVPTDVCNRFMMPYEVGAQMQSAVGRYVRHMFDAFVGSKIVSNSFQEMVQGRCLRVFLEDHVRVIPARASKEINPAELAKIDERNKRFLTNFDHEEAYFLGTEFMRGYFQLIEDIRNPANGYDYKALAVAHLEAIMHKTISVHDVYVPYCFLHPEKIETQRMTIGCTPTGETVVQPGEKHEVVTNLDHRHFENFVKEYLK